MSLQLIDRFHPRLRREQQAAIDAGQLDKRDELELLDPERLRPLALLSLYLLVGGGVFFVVLNIAAYFWQKHTLALGLTGWGVVIWLLLNIVGYIIVLPLHEVLHGLAFAFWGGKPYYAPHIRSLPQWAIFLARQVMCGLLRGCCGNQVKYWWKIQRQASEYGKSLHWYLNFLEFADKSAVGAINRPLRFPRKDAERQELSSLRRDQ